jgi:hypothetical protein
LADKARESTNGSKPLIAGRNAAATRRLDIGKKATDEIGRDVL